MPVDVDITDDDITYAEQILLPDGGIFDEERRQFIKRLDTLDLQAVPGSGKTTALLAKLLIIERYLPFADGSGVLAISHTNAAVDEIKARIGKQCPKLFSYPNFIGTIQAFVDHFLAIPWYANKYGKRPVRIDNEIYSEVTNRFFTVPLGGFNRNEENNARYLLRSNDAYSAFRFSVVDGQIRLTNKFRGSILNITKPRGNTRPANYVDWTDDEKERVRQWLFKFKMKLLKNGILCFDDAYFLAELYLEKVPYVKKLLQKRFSFVFIDEMQDMSKHQYDLMERLFYDDGHSHSRYQRIGDRNQAIYDAGNFQTEDIWMDRQPVLNLSNSYRLSPSVANVLNFFALHRGSGFQVNGLQGSDIKPHVIVYDDQSLCEVVPKFSSILHELMCNARIGEDDNKMFKVVAWSSVWSDENTAGDRGKIRLVDYCPSFQKAQHKPSVDYDCLQSYLLFFDRKKKMLGIVQNNILNALIKILRLEGILNQENNHGFTGTSLLRHLKENDPEFYDEFRLNLYKWSFGLVKGNVIGILSEIRLFIPLLLLIFNKYIDKSRAFIEQALEESGGCDLYQGSHLNTVNYDGFNIELATVHSVKGKTHTATLYLETYFQKDGNGTTAKSYESQRLSNQFKGSYLTGNEGVRVKQSARMVYVGFSRSTHLLCFAVHKDRFDQYLADLDVATWEIIRIDDQNRCHS